jgi:hypothetical protein
VSLVGFPLGFTQLGVPGEPRDGLGVAAGKDIAEPPHSGTRIRTGHKNVVLHIDRLAVHSTAVRIANCKQRAGCHVGSAGFSPGGSLCHEYK